MGGVTTCGCPGGGGVGPMGGGVGVGEGLLGGAHAVTQITSQRIVTVAMKEVVFHAPVKVGEAVSFYANVTRVGNTSVSVHVDVEVKRARQRIQVTEADLTFVCVDDKGEPTPVRLIEN